MEGERAEGEAPGLRATLITSLPFGTAIGVFGVVFGAAVALMLRALAAAILVVLSALFVPALFDYAPIIVAILVALPPRRAAAPTTPEPAP